MGGSLTPRRRRLLLALGALTVLVSGAVGVLRSDAFERRLLQAVQAAASRASGHTVLLGDVRWDQGALHVLGVVVLDDQGSTVASLGAGRATWTREGLRPRIDVLELEQPVVRLTLVDGQIVELEHFDGELPDRLPWNDLAIDGGSLELRLADTALRVDDVDLTPVGQGRADLSLGEVAWRDQVQGRDVVLPGVRVASDGVDLPQLDLDLPLGTLQGWVSLPLEGPISGLLSCEIAPSTLTAPGWTIDGSYAFDATLMGTLDAPVAELALAVDPLLLGPKPGAEVMVPGLIWGTARVTPQGMELVDVRTGLGGGDLVATGQLDWQGNVERLQLVGEGLSLAQVADQLGPFPDAWVGLDADLEMELSGTLKPMVLTGPVVVAGTDLRVAAGGLDAGSQVLVAAPRASLQGQVEFVKQGVTVTADAVQVGRTSGSVRAWLPWREPPFNLVADLTLDLETLRPMGGAGLDGRGPMHLELVGPYARPVMTATTTLRDPTVVNTLLAERLQTQLRMDDLRHLHFIDLQTETGETRIKGQAVLDLADGVHLDLDAIVPDGRLQDLLGLYVNSEGIQGVADGSVRVSGPVSALDGELDLALRDVDLYGERFPQGRLHVDVDDSRSVIDALVLRRGDEQLVATGSIEPTGELDVVVRSHDARLEQVTALGQVPAQGAVGLALHIGGHLAEPEPQGQLTLRSATLRREDLPPLTLELATEGTHMAWTLQGQEHVDLLGHVELAGTWPWSAQGSVQGLPLQGVLPAAGDGRPVHLRVDADLELQGDVDGGGTGWVQVSAARLGWRSLDLVLRDPAQVDLVEGIWRLDAPARLVGDGTDVVLQGHIGRGQVHAVADGHVDAAWTPMLTEHIDQASGALTLSARLDGPTGDPKGGVDLRLDDGSLRSPWFPHPLEHMDATARLEPSQLVLESLSAQLGGGQARMSGRAASEAWVPRRMELTASVDDARINLFEWLPPGILGADLQLTGPLDQLLLAGQIDIDDMLFTERVDYEQWAVGLQERALVERVKPRNPDPLFDLDLRVRADDTLRLSNNLAEGTGSADLRVVGDIDRVGLLGDLWLKTGTRVFLQGREFTATRAEAHFLDPYAYDPDVDIVLETDVRTTDRTVHVEYALFGPLSAVRSEPRSDPDLPPGDINALVLFGVTREELEQGGGAGTALALEGIDLLLTGQGSQALSGLPGEDALGDVFQYTRLDLVTGVTQRGGLNTSDEWRILVETNVREPLQVQVTGEFSLQDQYISLERELTDQIYVTTFWSTEQRQRRLGIGGAYGADVRVKWSSD
jgi:hypothetical protein